MHLLGGLSCTIKDIEIVNLQTHDGIMKKLNEVRYIPNFRSNLILLSRLDSSSYK